MDLKVQPDVILLDGNTGVSIATQWNLDHDNCPFLSNEGKCKVYDVRPLICQAYPIKAFGLLDVDNEKQKSIAYGDCPNVAKLSFREDTPLHIRTKQVFKELFRVYENCFVGMLRLDAATKIYKEVLTQLLKEKVIRPLPINKEVRKAILRGKPIGLLEFLAKKNLEMGKKMKKEIDAIYEVDALYLDRLLKT